MQPPAALCQVRGVGGMPQAAGCVRLPAAGRRLPDAVCCYGSCATDELWLAVWQQYALQLQPAAPPRQHHPSLLSPPQPPLHSLTSCPSIFRQFTLPTCPAVYHVTQEGWTKVRGEDVGELHFKYYTQPEQHPCNSIDPLAV